MKYILRTLAFLLLACSIHAADRVVYEGGEGPGKGKHIVFLTGDDEYRSEEGLPMLAKILSKRHGFKSTVLFSLAPDGTINPKEYLNLPGWDTIKTADCIVMLMRFREPSDESMRYFVDYLEAGKPVIALRTSTHAFSYEKNKTSKYAKYDWRSKEWPGGFGQQVLGDTWVSHHGDHGKQSTRGIINQELKNHPILTAVDDVWGPTDVYGIVHLPADAKVLLKGQVLEGMKPTDKPLEGKKNDPMMPLAWIREYKWETGNTSRIFCTTMGGSTDLESAGLRRLVVNAVYWGIGMDKQITPQLSVDYVGDYKPIPFGFDKFKKGVSPSEYELK